MKSSLIDDEDEVKMSGVVANEDPMVDQDQSEDQDAAQAKQMSAGQSFESGNLVSSQNQAAGSNAPIEIRKKEEGKQDGEEVNGGDQAETKKSDMADAVKDQRDKLKKVAMRIFHQIKSGCSKDLCLNVHCRTNLFGKYCLKMKKSSDYKINLNLLFSNSNSFLLYSC